MNEAAQQDDTEVLERLVNWHESYEQSTTESRLECERDRDYYDHKQYTQAEIATLNKRKQPVVTANRIKPKVDFMLGMERQRRTDPKAYPRNPGDEEGANAASDALRYVVDDQLWDRKRSDCFENLLIEGACGADICIRKTKNGNTVIEINQVPWDRMWGDPHSRKRDWSDGKVRGQYLWMDLEDAKQRYPDQEDKLESTINGESMSNADTFSDVPRTRWADPKRKRIRVVEAWSREGEKIFYSAFTKAGLLERMESPYVNEEGDPEDGLVFSSAFIDRDGNRYGAVRGWISLQDEVNKRRSKALHLLSVRQTKGEKGAVDDVRKAKAELAKPDGHVEVTPGMVFEILPTGDMAQAQFQLLAEAKGEIDAVGVNAALSGNESRVMSGRALQAKSEQGLAELGPVFDAFNQFQHDVYRKVWNRIKQYWTAEKWVRVTEDGNNVRFVGLNTPMTMADQIIDEAKKAGKDVPEELQAQMRQDPQLQGIVGTRNNVAKLDVDIVIEDAPASASIQSEEFQALMQVAPAMAQAGKPIDPEILIEASSLRTKDKILKKMRGEEGKQLPPEVQQKLQQMEEQIAQMDQQMQQAAQHIEQLEQEKRAAEDKQANEHEKNGIARYDAETRRIAALQPPDPGMTPEQVQLMVMDLLRQQMPQSAMMMPDEPPQGGFFYDRTNAGNDAAEFIEGTTDGNY